MNTPAKKTETVSTNRKSSTVVIDPYVYALRRDQQRPKRIENKTPAWHYLASQIG